MANIKRQIEQQLEKSNTEDGQVDGAKQPTEATATAASQKTCSRQRKPTPKAQAATQQQAEEVTSSSKPEAD
jgi:hypothetical protein